MSEVEYALERAIKAKDLNGVGEGRERRCREEKVIAVDPAAPHIAFLLVLLYRRRLDEVQHDITGIRQSAREPY